VTGPGEEPGVLDVLDLEEIDRDLYRSTLLFTDPLPLYGGQVAAQALRAAGATVAADRLPHSLHGYFLRSGDAGRPVVFRVDRDRDGGSFSARRVVALQGGEVVFNMSASFAVAGDGPTAGSTARRSRSRPTACPATRSPACSGWRDAGPGSPTRRRPGPPGSGRAAGPRCPTTRCCTRAC